MKMFASLAVVALVLTVAVVVAQGTGLLASVPVMAQSTIAGPGKPVVRKGDRPGEVVVSWESVVGAQAYRVGWLKEEHMQQAGPRYADFIEDSRVRVTERDNTVRGLVPGHQYWFLVGSLDEIGRVYWSPWSEKIASRASPVPPSNCPPGAPAAHDGYGAYCPITGLRLGEEYYQFNETANWQRFRFTVNGASILKSGASHRYVGETPFAVSGDSYYLPRIAGRQHLRLDVTIENDGRNVQLHPGREYTMDTNAGVAFILGGARTLDRGARERTELVFEIPDGADMAILAMRPLYHSALRDLNEPTLFQVPLDGLRECPGGVEVCSFGHHPR